MRSLRTLYAGFASFAMLVCLLAPVSAASALEYDEYLTPEALDASAIIFMEPNELPDVLPVALICDGAEQLQVRSEVPHPFVAGATTGMAPECAPSIGRDPPAD